MTGSVALGLGAHGLDPSLSEREFVFCSFPGAHLGDLESLRPVAVVWEAEGLSVVLDRGVATDHGLAFEGIFRRISLGARTSLQSVGLTALLARVLADHGISANVVAGYHHDHFFVPAGRAEQALRLLQAQRWPPAPG